MCADGASEVTQASPSFLEGMVQAHLTCLGMPRFGWMTVLSPPSASAGSLWLLLLKFQLCGQVLKLELGSDHARSARTGFLPEHA